MYMYTYIYIYTHRYIWYIYKISVSVHLWIYIYMERETEWVCVRERGTVPPATTMPAMTAVTAGSSPSDSSLRNVTVVSALAWKFPYGNMFSPHSYGRNLLLLNLTEVLLLPWDVPLSMFVSVGSARLDPAWLNPSDSSLRNVTVVSALACKKTYSV